jgi:ATP-dependent Clp protease ATP-binding subunit ClpA
MTWSTAHLETVQQASRPAILVQGGLAETLVHMEDEVFDEFSERSIRVAFLARMDAGRRGAPTLDPAHLLEALVREDQGEMAARFQRAMTSSGPLKPPERPFFSAEVASQILSMLEDALPPQASPVANSADMECSPALHEAFARASGLAKELHHDMVEPLHLLAAMLSTTDSGAGEILRRLGISREAVIAAIQS